MFTASTTAGEARLVPNTQAESPETDSLFIGLGAALGAITLIAIVTGTVVACRRKQIR